MSGVDNPIRVLVLGGTSEASDLVRRLAAAPRYAPVLSLAGRTSAPRRAPVPTRVGGFGGVAGLARWLAEQSTDVVIDATHPFAARISQNAVQAAEQVGIPIITILRPPWTPVASDTWVPVPTMAAAVVRLGVDPQRVWLTIGGNELAAFRDAPQHDYLIRAVEPPPPVALPPRHRVILARGPFELAEELNLLEAERIDVLVTKNSGGAATAQKLAAARVRGLPVIMVERPVKAARITVGDVDAALALLEREAQRVSGRQ